MATKKTTAKAETTAQAETKKTTAKKATTKKAETKAAAVETKAATEAVEVKAEKKPAAKKTATKKTTTKKAAAKVEVFVEFAGAQVALDEVIANVKKANGEDAKNYTIYLKPEENKAYYVADGVEKEMDVFFIG